MSRILTRLELAFAGRRHVQIYLATSTATPALRDVIFYYPDATRWSGWEPA